jgi:tetratricopeptide (TPR) repeat protein
MTRSQPLPSRRSVLARHSLSLLLLGAFVIKAIVLAQLHDHPLLQPTEGLDSGYYVDLARRVTAGDLAAGPGAFFVSPLYIYFLALVFAVGGGSLLAAKAVQIGLGTVAIGLTFRTAQRWFGERAAWLAAGFALGTGLFTFYEVVILQAALDPFLTSLELYLIGRAWSDPRLWPACAAGAALGLHALNRPNVLPFAALIVVLILASRRPGRGVRRAAALAGTLALMLAPAAIHNYLATGELILVSSHGGLNFYIGNNAEADGTYHSVPGITPNIAGQARDADRVAEQGLGRRLTPGQVSDYFYSQAWRWIREHPKDALLLQARKLAYVANRVPLSLNYSYTYYSRDESTLLRALIIGPWLLVPLGLVGLVLRPPGLRPPGYWAWAAFVPAYGLAVAVFFVSSRYRMPLLVPFCASAGGAVSLAFERVRARRGRALLVPAACLALLFVAANWDFGLDDGRAEERTAMVLSHIERHEPQEALRLLGRLEPEHPQPGVLNFRAGRAFASQGETALAIERFERALGIDPGQPEVRFSLGEALLDAGRTAQAIPHLRAAFEAKVRREVSGYDLARALAGVGERQQALDVLRSIVLPTDADANSWLGLGELALQLDDPQLAGRLLNEASVRAPDVGVIHEKLGLALALLNQPTGAIAQLEEARRLDPRSPSVNLNLAVLYAQLGRREEARIRLDEALRLKPDYAQARQLLDRLFP